MKAQFLSRLVNTTWNISPLRGRAAIGAMILKLLKQERPDESRFGEPLPVMSIAGDVAVIPISGCLMLNVPAWAKEWGFDLTDPNDIEDELEQALNDPRVSIIVQAIDSGGGESMAGEKLFEIFDAARRKKPVMTYSGDGQYCCSAAYQSAAASNAVYSGRFAIVGSVGTYCMTLDDTGYWEQLGMKWEIFRSGEFKALGEDSLTTEQRDYLQSTTEEFGARFRSMVLKYRVIEAANLRGQDYRGVEAAKLGFVGGFAKNLDEAIAKFRRTL